MVLSLSLSPTSLKCSIENQRDRFLIPNSIVHITYKFYKLVYKEDR